MTDSFHKKLSSTKPHLHEKKEFQTSSRYYIVFILLHVFMGLLAQVVPQISTVHVYLTIGIGILLVLSRPRIHAAYAASYVVGSEVFWRMTEAIFIWEGGKYVVVLFLTLSMLHHRIKLIPTLPLVYFVFLLPSIVLTIATVTPGAARQMISFNLSGPLALFVSAWFFSNTRIKKHEIFRLLVSLTAPIAATAAFALFSTFTASEIQWVNDSMFQTSGGFGPNQVSLIMGLGLMGIIWLVLINDNHPLERVFFLMVASAFLVQALLTFSRLGIFGALLSAITLTLYTATDQRLRSRTLALGSVVVAVLTLFILPTLDDFTEGHLGLRFIDLDLTNRDVILSQELYLFQSNFVFGVGPGLGSEARNASAHTEFTRMLAEHGILGAISVIVLLLTVVSAYSSSKSRMQRGWTGSYAIWVLLMMSVTAMRLAAIPFVFGLLLAKIEFSDEVDQVARTTIVDDR